MIEGSGRRAESSSSRWKTAFALDGPLSLRISERSLENSVRGRGHAAASRAARSTRRNRLRPPVKYGRQPTVTNYPANFHILLDPDYVFTNAYGLSWNVQNETSDPSTFVINEKRRVTFAKVNKTHGDRSKVEDVRIAGS